MHQAIKSVLDAKKSATAKAVEKRRAQDQRRWNIEEPSDKQIQFAAIMAIRHCVEELGLNWREAVSQATLQYGLGFGEAAKIEDQAKTRYGA